MFNDIINLKKNCGELLYASFTFKIKGTIICAVYSTHYNQTNFTLQNQKTTNPLEWTRDTQKLQEAHTTK